MTTNPPPDPASRDPKSRPPLISRAALILVAVIQFLAGTLLFVVSSWNLAESGFQVSTARVVEYIDSPATLYALAFTSLVLGVLGGFAAVAAVFLFLRRRWAWKLSLIVNIILVASSGLLFVLTSLKTEWGTEWDTLVVTTLVVLLPFTVPIVLLLVARRAVG